MTKSEPNQNEMASLPNEPGKSDQKTSSTLAKRKKHRLAWLLTLALLLLLLLYLLWLFSDSKRPASRWFSRMTVTRIDSTPSTGSTPSRVLPSTYDTNGSSPVPTDVKTASSITALPVATLPHATLSSDVGVVDMARLLAAHPQTSIDAEHFKLEREILNRELERLKAEGKDGEATQFAIHRRREIDLDERNTRQKIISEIRGMIATHSKSGKFALVLDKSGSGTNNTPYVLDAELSLPDLTEETLKAIRR